MVELLRQIRPTAPADGGSSTIHGAKLTYRILLCFGGAYGVRDTRVDLHGRKQRLRSMRAVESGNITRQRFRQRTECQEAFDLATECAS